MRLRFVEGVGAAADLQNTENGLSVKRGSVEALVRAFATLAVWDDAHYTSCEASSLRLAANFGPRAYAKSIAMALDSIDK